MQVQQWLLINAKDSKIVLQADNEAALIAKASEFTINGGSDYYTAKVESKITHVKQPVVSVFGE